MKPSSSETKPGLEEKPGEGQQRCVRPRFRPDNLGLRRQPHPSMSKRFRNCLLKEFLVTRTQIVLNLKPLSKWWKSQPSDRPYSSSTRKKYFSLKGVLSACCFSRGAGGRGRMSQMMGLSTNYSLQKLKMHCKYVSYSFLLLFLPLSLLPVSLNLNQSFPLLRIYKNRLFLSFSWYFVRGKKLVLRDFEIAVILLLGQTPNNCDKNLNGLEARRAQGHHPFGRFPLRGAQLRRPPQDRSSRRARAV